VEKPWTVATDHRGKDDEMGLKTHLVRCLAQVLLAALVCSGCVSSSPSEQRLARYKPNTDGIEPWAWKGGIPTATSSGPSGTNANMQTPEHSADGFSKILRKGDKIIVSLHDIGPTVDDIKYVIDERGNINLPLVGSVLLDGKRTFEAEELIQKAYIDGGFYRKIKVVVTAQEDEYWVLGEVKREGKYPLAGETTLLRAIASAGGYTDFAKRWAVEIKRGEKVTVYDVDKIADGKDKDPGIRSSDVISVPRRVF
jgi:protein involved in polysaccharide export with SLBB domain